MTEDFSGGNHNIVTEHISQTDASTTTAQPANKPKIKKPPRKSKIQPGIPGNNTEEKAVRTTSSCQSEPSRQTTPGTRYYTLINHPKYSSEEYICVCLCLLLHIRVSTESLHKQHPPNNSHFPTYSQKYFPKNLTLMLFSWVKCFFEF